MPQKPITSVAGIALTGGFDANKELAGAIKTVTRKKQKTIMHFFINLPEDLWGLLIIVRDFLHSKKVVFTFSIKEFGASQLAETLTDKVNKAKKA